MTEAYEYLLENGPSSLYSDETPCHPGFGARRREHIRSFDISTMTPAAASTNVGVSRRCVYYIGGEHSHEEILREFNRVNDDIFNEMPDRSLISNLPNEFHEAAKDMFDLSWGTGGGGGDHSDYGGVCPVCGEEYDVQLPRHLRKRCSKQ